MKRGAEAFVSYADFDKYNAALRRACQLRTWPLRGNPVTAVNRIRRELYPRGGTVSP